MQYFVHIDFCTEWTTTFDMHIALWNDKFEQDQKQFN